MSAVTAHFDWGAAGGEADGGERGGVHVSSVAADCWARPAGHGYMEKVQALAQTGGKKFRTCSVSLRRLPRGRGETDAGERGVRSRARLRSGERRTARCESAGSADSLFLLLTFGAPPYCGRWSFGGVTFLLRFAGGGGEGSTRCLRERACGEHVGCLRLAVSNTRGRGSGEADEEKVLGARLLYACWSAPHPSFPCPLYWLYDGAARCCCAP